MLVALAPPAAARGKHNAVRLAQVCKQVFPVLPFRINQGAYRQADNKVGALFAIALPPFPRLAILGFVNLLELEVVERKQTVVGTQVNRAAIAAVAAIRAAAGHELFPAE